MEAVIREGKLRVQTAEASCDVILSCQGHRLMAHKIVLSIASPILQDLLVQEFTEPAVLIFPDIHGNTMSLILDYIYTGRVTVYSNTINDFISAANLLKLHLDNDYLHKNNKLKKEDVYSKRNQRKMPSLVPLPNRPTKKTKDERKTIGCVIPSPWCSRGMSVLSDPRTCYSTPEAWQYNNFHAKNEENDSNNNLKSTARDLSSTRVQSPTLTFDSIKPSSHPDPKDMDDDKLNLPQISKIHETISKRKKVRELKNVLKTEYKEESCEEKIKPFKCEDCGKTFSQLRNYKYHRSVHEGTKEFAAKCPECGKVFNDRGYLSSHMKIHRDRKEYACQHCPKRFNQRVAYNMHLRIHTGIKPHECPTCGKTFSRKMLLKQHQRVHTGERPYSCPECGKSFADRSNMSLHARLHTGVKPYSCNLCSKSFTKKHHLKTHMNFHTGLKPYKCEKCGLAFSQSSNMRTHYKKCVLKESGPSSIIDGDSNSSDAK